MSKFRVNAKHFSLTYPRCDIPRDVALTLLRRTNHSDFSHFFIAQEHHTDNGLHLHIYLQFDHKKNITLQTAFDLTYKDLIYHPNIQATKNRQKWLGYLAKEDKDALTNISKDSIGDLWAAVVQEEDPDVAIKLIAEKDPKKLVNNWNNINNYVRATKKPKLEEWKPKFPLDQFNIPELVDRWKWQIGRQLDRTWLLFLVGPPDLGKTALMRSIGPHIYVRGYWALEPFLQSSGAQFVILDDVLLNVELLLPSRAILLGMEGGCWLTDKYHKKTFIDTSGLPCCIISNSDDLAQKMKQIPAWDKQFHVCYVDKKLFNEEEDQ